MSAKSTISHARKAASRGVLLLLATAQALQVGHSGYVYVGIIGGVIGGLIGAGITLSVTRAASNIGAVRKRGKARYSLALVGLVGLMVLNPCLIFPGAYQVFDIDTPWMLIMAAIAWAVAPDLSMVLTGAITGTGMFASEQPAPQVATNAPTRKQRGRKLPISDNKLLSYWQQHPTSSNAETGRAFGVTAEAIRKRRANLTIPV